MDEKIQRARVLCLDQAEGFIAAADRLGGGADWPHIVYHLSLLALEEVGKASMLVESSRLPITIQIVARFSSRLSRYK